MSFSFSPLQLPPPESWNDSSTRSSFRTAWLVAPSGLGLNLIAEEPTTSERAATDEKARWKVSWWLAFNPLPTSSVKLVRGCWWQESAAGKHCYMKSVQIVRGSPISAIFFGVAHFLWPQWYNFSYKDIRGIFLLDANLITNCILWGSNSNLSFKT